MLPPMAFKYFTPLAKCLIPVATQHIMSCPDAEIGGGRSTRRSCSMSASRFVRISL